MEVIGEMDEGDDEKEDISDSDEDVFEYQGVKHSRSDILQWFR